MKQYLLFLILVIAIACQEQTPPDEPEREVSAETTKLDLATELGADEYGMRKYVMAFLKAGPNRSQDSLEAAELQKAHLANIERMAKEGTLVVAGPFLDDGDMRGIYIFSVDSVEEAKALTETDPAIQAGRLMMELRPWYGPAGLMKMKEIHEQLEQESED